MEPKCCLYSRQQRDLQCQTESKMQQDEAYFSHTANKL